MNGNAITQLVWGSTGSLFTSPYERRNGTTTGQTLLDGQFQSSFASSSRKVVGYDFGLPIGTVNGGFSSNNGDLVAQSMPTEAQKYLRENGSISAREFDRVSTDFGDFSVPSRTVPSDNRGGGFGRSAESGEYGNLDPLRGRSQLSGEASDFSSPTNDIRTEANTEPYSADESSNNVDDARVSSGERGLKGANDGGKGERNSSAESESGKGSPVNEHRNKTNRSERRSSKSASENRSGESAGGKNVESREGIGTARGNSTNSGSGTVARTSGPLPAVTSSTMSGGSNSGTPSTNTGLVQSGSTSSVASSTLASSGAEARNGGSEFRAVSSSKSNNAESASTSSNSATSQSKAPAFTRGVLAMTHTQGGSMTMKLTPESLGPLRIQMTVHQAEISIQFHTQTFEAGVLIRDSLDGLRSALESQGYRMGPVTIQPLSRTEGGEGNAGGTNHQSGDQSGQHEQHDAGEGRSRGFQERSRFQGARPFGREQSRTEGFASHFGTTMKSNVIK